MSNNKTELMIDIETLGTRANSIIVSMAAIKFKRNKEDAPKLEDMDTFYVRISIESCEVLGMTKENSTIEWWKKQPDDIRFEALENPDNRLPIKVALEKLKEWINDDNIKIWSHGNDFDCSILSEAYKICSQEIPWKFWNTRDTRTIYDIAGVRLNDINIGNKHHPIFDCYRQIIALKKSIKKINI